jgi:hypothetical protein
MEGHTGEHVRLSQMQTQLSCMANHALGEEYYSVHFHIHSHAAPAAPEQLWGWCGTFCTRRYWFRTRHVTIEVLRLPIAAYSILFLEKIIHPASCLSSHHKPLIGTTTKLKILAKLKMASNVLLLHRTDHNGNQSSSLVQLSKEPSETLPRASTTINSRSC